MQASSSNTMSTNRPFLSNFFAAFRAHSAIQKAATNSPSGTGTSSTASSYAHNTTAIQQSASTSTSPNASSAPRTIATKASHSGAGATTAAVQAAAQFQPTRQHAASPYSRSPGSPGSPGFPMSSPSHKQRRGSDSSSDGFREVTDKWYIGGRTATGEERFYRLGMVKRQKSIDRLSLDRLSI